MKLERAEGKGAWSGEVVAPASVAVVGRAEAGQEGEERAARHLEALGYEVVARNWRDRGGELDLVVRRGPCLVVVEVRTRRRASAWRPEQSVRAEKQRRVVGAARRWLAKEGGWCCVPGWSLRFDVVGVVLEEGSVRHLEAAFDPSPWL